MNMNTTFMINLFFKISHMNIITIRKKKSKVRRLSEVGLNDVQTDACFMKIQIHETMSNVCGVREGCVAAPSGDMRLFGWNCRGLDKPRTVRELTDLVRIYKISIIG